MNIIVLASGINIQKSDLLPERSQFLFNITNWTEKCFIIVHFLLKDLAMMCCFCRVMITSMSAEICSFMIYKVVIEIFILRKLKILIHFQIYTQNKIYKVFHKLFTLVSLPLLFLPLLYPVYSLAFIQGKLLLAILEHQPVFFLLKNKLFSR